MSDESMSPFRSEWTIGSDSLKSEFVRQIEGESNQRVSLCVQCGKCATGCPVVSAMDYTPNQVVRMIQFGMEERVLHCRTIWLCASCYTCGMRCPQEVDLAKIMDALRIRARRQGAVPPGETGALFNKAFLNSIRRHGRLYELGLIASYNLRSGQPFKDFSKAPEMLWKGKLRLLPHWIKDKKWVREVFERLKEKE